MDASGGRSSEMEKGEGANDRFAQKRIARPPWWVSGVAPGCSHWWMAISRTMPDSLYFDSDDVNYYISINWGYYYSVRYYSIIIISKYICYYCYFSSCKYSRFYSESLKWILITPMIGCFIYEVSGCVECFLLIFSGCTFNGIPGTVSREPSTHYTLHAV